MPKIGPENSSDPRTHSKNIKDMLSELRDDTRQDVTKVSDPKARALFEVTAEVLQGLVKAMTITRAGPSRAGGK